MTGNSAARDTREAIEDARRAIGKAHRQSERNMEAIGEAREAIEKAARRHRLAMEVSVRGRK